jgi:putative peptidoglycan lipid II flippase
VAQNTLQVVLALALEPVLGVPGLAVAYAVSYSAAAVLALVVLRKLGGGRLDGRRVARSVAKVLVACVVMAVAVMAVSRFVGDDDGAGAIVRTVVGVLVGGATFAVAVVALRVEEVTALRQRVLRRGP